MTILITISIGVLIVVLFLIFNHKGKQIPVADVQTIVNVSPKTLSVKTVRSDIQYDETGRPFRWIDTTREKPRRTYVKATLTGKYWGIINKHISDKFEHADFFDFNIYEVQLTDAYYQATPFHLKEDLRIPREKIPPLLHTTLHENGMVYNINLLEPTFSNIQFLRKLHQVDKEQVFGTIQAEVTGYMLDYVFETSREIAYHGQTNTIPATTATIASSLKKTDILTGYTEREGNYERTQKYYSDLKSTYFGEWRYVTHDKTSDGCLPSIFGIIGLILAGIFLIYAAPQLGVLLLLYLALVLLAIIPSAVLTWIFRILGIAALVFLVINIINAPKTPHHPYLPRETAINQPRETNVQTIPFTNTVNNVNNVNTPTMSDTLIQHFRSWVNYDGDTLEGVIWVRNSDYLNARNYKNNLQANESNDRAYDKLLYTLKEFDKEKLSGVYQLFDSIKITHQLSGAKFAEALVSFVQDIPYTVVLPYDCNAAMYNDDFIRKYLQSENARCDGFEKFGINTPVEFMATLNGDCDTRTLLLYTILSHYGYDVVLLSSEYYKHSILGINLPYNGLAYTYNNCRYVFWETTTPGRKPGLIPTEISNLSYWRISLKSK